MKEAPQQAADKAALEVEPTVDRFLAAYLMGTANRLTNGASRYYRQKFNLGMSEWRAMMAIGAHPGLIGRQVADLADLDHAAASKSVRLLHDRGLVSLEQTNRRGRAALVRLTPEGKEVYRKLRQAALRRHKRLLAAFTPEETELLWSLLRRVRQQLPYMNGE